MRPLLFEFWVLDFHQVTRRSRGVDHVSSVFKTMFHHVPVPRIGTMFPERGTCPRSHSQAGKDGTSYNDIGT